jgi:hypothetical protein
VTGIGEHMMERRRKHPHPTGGVGGPDRPSPGGQGERILGARNSITFWKGIDKTDRI